MGRQAPRSAIRMAATRHCRRYRRALGRSALKNLTAVAAGTVLAARRAGGVRQVLRTAGRVGTGHGLHRGRLPLGPTRPRVAAGHLPLRNSHGVSPSIVVPPMPEAAHRGQSTVASVRTHACTLYSAGSSRCKRQPNLRVSLPETPPTAELIAVLEHCTVPAMTEQQVFMPTTTKAVFMPCCRMR